jgi:hypothetical protein
MPKPRNRQAGDQLNLFHPRPTVPRWQALPPKVRKRVTHLLSQLLQNAVQDLVRGEEVRDE